MRGLAFGLEPLPSAAPLGEKPYLGINIRPVGDPSVRQLNVQVDSGAVLSRVYAESPIEKAGLRAGDVIVKFGDDDVGSCDELMAVGKKLVVDKTYRVEFYRGDKRYFVNVTVGRQPGTTPIEDVARLRCVLPIGDADPLVFNTTVKVDGLAGVFSKDSPEMAYYKFRWLPGSMEITPLEEDFPVAGAKMPLDPASYLLLTGYQTDGTPVTVRVTCEDSAQAGERVDAAGWRWRLLGHKVELLQFVGHDAPGLYSIDIKEPTPGTFTWTPKKFDNYPYVCGPQVVGVYVVHNFEREKIENGEVVETEKVSMPYRVAWLLLGCPGDTVEKDNRQYVVRDPRQSSASSSPGQERWYRHVEGAYRFRIPEGWRIIPNTRGSVADPEFDTLSNPDGSLKLICQRGHSSADEPAEALDSFTRAKVAEQRGAKAFHFALKDAPVVRISYPIGNPVGHVSRLSFIRNGKRYIINTVVLGDTQIAKLDPRVSEILGSLQFLENIPRELDTLASDEPKRGDAAPPAETDAIEPLPDEAEAMAAVDKSPTPGNIAALAKIRAQHGVQLFEMARQKQDDNMLRLALNYALSATELAPEEPLYWFLLAQIYAENTGNPLADRLADEAAQAALKRSPDDSRIRLFRGQLKFRQEADAAALDEFERVIQTDPKFIAPPLIAMMTTAYLRDADTQRGVDFLTKLLAAQPEADCARLALAILLHESGKDDAARAELRKVSESSKATAENRAYAQRLPELWGKEGSL